MKKKKIKVFVLKSHNVEEEETIVVSSHIPYQIFKNKKIIVKIKDKKNNKIDNKYYYTRYNNYNILLNYNITELIIKDNNIFIKFKYLDDKTYKIKLNIKYNDLKKSKDTIYSKKYLLMKNKGLYNYKTKKRGNLYIKL